MFRGLDVGGTCKNVNGAAEHRVDSAEKHEEAKNVTRTQVGIWARRGKRVVFGAIDVKLFVHGSGRERGRFGVGGRRKDFADRGVFMNENAVIGMDVEAHTQTSSAMASQVMTNCWERDSGTC